VAAAAVLLARSGTSVAAALPPLNDADGRVAAALNELLGRKAVASFLDTSGFVRHFVATVDNLPRAQASSRMWPTQRAPKAFEVQGSGELKTIGADNASRYVGAAFGVTVVTVLAQRPAADAAAGLVEGWNLAVLIGIGLCVAGALGVVLLQRADTRLLARRTPSDARST
jgi:hypothetical protein